MSADRVDGALACRIRKARPDDADAACALLRESIVRSFAADHRHDPAVLERWLANKTAATVGAWIRSPSNHCVVALIDDVVAGVAILTRKGKIGLLHVHPDRLGQGIGTVLLQALEAQAAGWGLASVRVDSVRSVQPFYARHGYIDGAGFTTMYGIDAVFMARRVRSNARHRPTCACVPACASS